MAAEGQLEAGIAVAVVFRECRSRLPARTGTAFPPQRAKDGTLRPWNAGGAECVFQSARLRVTFADFAGGS